MKFAKQLSLRTIPNWEEHYVDYKGLKKYIKESQPKYAGTVFQCAIFDRQSYSSTIHTFTLPNYITTESNNDATLLASISDHFRELLVVELQKVEGHYLIRSKEGSEQLEEQSAAVSIFLCVGLAVVSSSKDGQT
ncbi:hypothetical protein BC938DRAFT_476160 [Jimgerdemannia flammicorona]|uniref:SPX domain-containing protein n=1 Tax=Jimgerdemannia flammicorona TaxID=994334 RepID=A0A433PJT5_9FUNG|nr:hypothetical protein BC938DRAFT_476160 [Jimgerdemannia flammicorona]